MQPQSIQYYNTASKTEVTSLLWPQTVFFFFQRRMSVQASNNGQDDHIIWAQGTLINVNFVSVFTALNNKKRMKI